jgi:hypothetical protein
MLRIAWKSALAWSCLALVACGTSSGSSAPLTEGTVCTQQQHDTSPVCSGTQTFNCKLNSDGSGNYHWDMVADCKDTAMSCSQGQCVGSGNSVLTEGTVCTQQQHDTSPVCSGTQTFNCKLNSDGSGNYHWDMVTDCKDTAMTCSKGQCVAQ